MRPPSLLLALSLAALAACSERPAGQPAERPIGMPEDVWKLYGGVESGVGDAQKDAPKEPK